MSTVPTAAIFLAALAGAAAQDKPAVPPAPPRPSIAVPRDAPPVSTIATVSPRSDPSAPRPINAGRWISQADYPAAALQAGAEGPVGIRLRVSELGRVTGCEVTASSGNADLDAATCRLTAQRGRFDPGRNGKGDPIAANFDTTVRWVLHGQLRPLPGAGELVISLTVAPDGTVSDCSFTASGAAAAASPDPCKTIRFAPQAEPGAKVRRVRLTTKVEDLAE